MISQPFEHDGTAANLAANGGIYHFSRTIEGSDIPQDYVNVLGVELPTYATAGEVAAIKGSFDLTPLDQRLLRVMAECRSMRMPLHVEGEPATGKTFMGEQFLKLLEGTTAPLLTDTGTPKTTEDELFGSYRPVGENGRFAFIPGPLLKATTARDGQGAPLFIDELNLLQPNHQQVLLPMSGKDGRLGEGLHFYGNGDQTYYPFGPNTWLLTAANFPERTLGRSVVVDALASRLVWYAITDTERNAKVKALIRSGGRGIGGPAPLDTNIIRPMGTPFEWYKHPEVAQQLTDTVFKLHENLDNHLRGAGDTLGEGEDAEPRLQPMTLTARDALRLYHYIEHMPVRDKHGTVDVAATIKQGYQHLYLGRLASSETRTEVSAELQQLVYGEVGKVRHNGQLLTRADLFTQLLRTPKGSKQQSEPAPPAGEGDNIILSTADRLALEEQNHLQTTQTIKNIETLLRDGAGKLSDEDKALLQASLEELRTPRG